MRCLLVASAVLARRALPEGHTANGPSVQFTKRDGPKGMPGGPDGQGWAPDEVEQKRKEAKRNGTTHGIEDWDPKGGHYETWAGKLKDYDPRTGTSYDPAIHNDPAKPTLAWILANPLMLTRWQAVGDLPEHFGPDGYWSLQERLVNESQQPGVEKICEIGFNGAASSMLFLLANPSAMVYSFDRVLSNHGDAMHWFANKYFPKRFSLVPGDPRYSVETFQQSNRDVVCDFMFISGASHYDELSWDLINMKRMASRDGHIIVDNTNCVGDAGDDFCAGPTRVLHDMVRTTALEIVNMTNYTTADGKFAPGSRGFSEVRFKWAPEAKSRRRGLQLPPWLPGAKDNPPLRTNPDSVLETHLRQAFQLPDLRVPDRRQGHGSRAFRQTRIRDHRR